MWSGRFRKMVLALGLLLATDGMPCRASGAPPLRKAVLQVPRVKRAPRLADFLKGRQREAEAVVTDFRQRQPHDGQPATRGTTAYLSYDDKNLYVVFICREDSGRVRAHLGKREDISGDDSVSLQVDTFHDGHRAYMFFVNPLGVQRDGITTEGQADDFSFDAMWYSEGRVTPEGYAVWMAIPFKSLRFSTAPDSSWGIALSRYIPGSKELSTWPYITDRVEAYVPQFGSLEGIHRARPGRNIQLIPYGFFTRQRFLDASLDSGPAFRRQTEWRGGLDAKIVLHDSLTLGATVNPDFSQVESDEPQVTINRRFEVFFPEKRPFFTEGAGFFDTPEELFFSRRIVDPQFGVRLTGKLGSWALGALAIDDRVQGRLLPGDDPLHDSHSRILVGRAQYEFPGQSTVGVFFARRQFGPSSSQMASVDTRLRLNAHWTLTAQAMRSHIRTLSGLTSSGFAYFIEMRRSGRGFNFYTHYRDRSPGFRSDLGFIPRVDIRQVKTVAGYRWWPERGSIVNLGPAIFAYLDWDHQGRLQDWSVDAPFYFNFRGPVSISAGRTESYELFENLRFREGESYVTASNNRLKWLGVSTTYSRGTGVNYFPAAGLAPFLAGSTETDFNLTLRPATRMRFEQAYLYTRLATIRESGLDGVVPGTSVFTNHVLRTKANYQFTRALSLRAIVDYNSVLANPSLVDVDRSKRITYDLLLTYLVHPGTAVYVGYSDRFANLTLDPSDPSGMRRVGSPSLSIGRLFFVKISYLLRF